MNRIFKTLILVVYTFAIFAIAFVIVSLADKGANFKNYSDKTADENIAVVTQIIEKRKNTKQTGTVYEESAYDLSFYIKKISSADLENIYVYIAAETEDGIRYVQSTSEKTLKGTSTVLSTISVLNSNSNEFAVNKVVNEEGEVKQINKIPQNFYIKVVYNKIVDKVKTPCELNCKIKYDDINKEEFNDFEKRDIITNNGTTQYIDYKEDYVSIKFLKLSYDKENNKVAYNDYRVSNVKRVLKNLPTDVSISKIKLEITAEATSESFSNTDYFSKYIKLFVYEGSLMSDISNSRTVSLAKGYEVEKVYFNIEVELENKEVHNFKYYVLTSELLDS